MIRTFNRKLYTRIFRLVAVEAKLYMPNRFGAVDPYKRGNTPVLDRERVTNISRLLILYLRRNLPVGDYAVVGVSNFREYDSHHENDAEKYISHYFFPLPNNFKAQSPYQIPANLNIIERPYRIKSYGPDEL